MNAREQDSRESKQDQFARRTGFNHGLTGRPYLIGSFWDQRPYYAKGWNEGNRERIKRNREEA